MNRVLCLFKLNTAALASPIKLTLTLARFEADLHRQANFDMLI